MTDEEIETETEENGDTEPMFGETTDGETDAESQETPAADVDGDDKPQAPDTDATAATTATSDETIGCETVTFAVDLHCEGCEDRVSEALLDRVGVREIKPNADEQQVTIGFTPHVTSTDDLQETITNLGHEVTPAAETTDAEGGAPTAAAARPSRETVPFEVSLHCEGCEDRVMSELTKRDGVHEVQADADDQHVIVEFDPNQISADALQTAISDLGYEVNQTEVAVTATD